MNPAKLLGAGATAMVLLVASPALALPGGVPDHGAASGSHAQSHTVATTPSTTAPTTPAQAKAYGVLCQSQKESKKHVAGQKGTPFSQCVVALAKLAKGQVHSTSAACKAESKKHVAGQKGTPFSRCVSAAAKLHKH
jgi:hypothetical protein